MSQPRAPVAMQFDNAAQQRNAATSGMWVFLATEILFFGGMFVAYAVYRVQYPEAFHAGGEHLNVWAGAAMTAILLTGSLLVVMSDHAIEAADDAAENDAAGLAIHDENGLRRTVFIRLLVTAILGTMFLATEFYEWGMLIEERLFPGAHFNAAEFGQLEFAGGTAQVFFSLFFCMTGLHALHMIIGVALVAGTAVAVYRAPHPTHLRNPLKVIGLYWHFVDIVWLFLYPLFYLVK